MAKRLSYEDIKERIEKEGYVLLSKEYINNKQKLEMICPKGHKHIGTWREFQSGCRCSECGGTKKKTYEEVKALRRVDLPVFVYPVRATESTSFFSLFSVCN